MKSSVSIKLPRGGDWLSQIPPRDGSHAGVTLLRLYLDPGYVAAKWDDVGVPLNLEVRRWTELSNATYVGRLFDSQTRPGRVLRRRAETDSDRVGFGVHFDEIECSGLKR